jgi:hypothetical protein
MVIPTSIFEATPIVEDGIMYLPNGWGVVYALDVSSGKKATIRWKFDPQTNRAWAGDVACCGVNNRGIALWKDKVISVSLDPVLPTVVRRRKCRLCRAARGPRPCPLFSIAAESREPQPSAGRYQEPTFAEPPR